MRSIYAFRLFLAPVLLLCLAVFIPYVHREFISVEQIQERQQKISQAIAKIETGAITPSNEQIVALLADLRGLESARMKYDEAINGLVRALMYLLVSIALVQFVAALGYIRKKIN